MIQISNDQIILDLINCQKRFRNRPKKRIEKNRNYDQRFDVFSVNDNTKFTVFITQSTRKLQDFSIGLMYDNYLLIRYNGFHGTTKAGFYSYEHHQYPHAHILTMEDIQSSRERKPSGIKILTGKFVNLDTAIVIFCKECGIIGYEEYFDEYKQISFF